MTTEIKTLGQAIDSIIAALSPLDENSRATAISAACAHLGLQKPTAPTVPNETAQSQRLPITSDPKIIDIRTFKETKNPASAIEMACVVAYYLENLAQGEEKKQEVVANDIEKYFKSAKYPLPKELKNVLPNAKAAGYLDSIKHGKYRLNPVGYNLVAHSLPRTASK